MARYSLRRKAARPLSAAETRKVIEDYASWEVMVNTAESVLMALDTEARYKISFRDALIVQAAGSCGAEVIYSEDLADRQSYGEVRVVNPLK
jgi:predicted nucleic acid-binding protein